MASLTATMLQSAGGIGGVAGSAALDPPATAGREVLIVGGVAELIWIDSDPSAGGALYYLVDADGAGWLVRSVDRPPEVGAALRVRGTVSSAAHGQTVVNEVHREVLPDSLRPDPPPAVAVEAGFEWYFQVDREEVVENVTADRRTVWLPNGAANQVARNPGAGACFQGVYPNDDY